MHNVCLHHVMRIAVPFDEKDQVRTIIESVNQFVADNYGEDDPRLLYCPDDGRRGARSRPH